MATRLTYFPELLVGIRKPSTDAMLNAGTVTFYEAGTTTLKTVYNDVAGTSAADNPKTLDAYGAARVYGEGVYKLVIKDSAGNTVWTWDNYKLRYYNVSVTSKSANYQATIQDDLILVDTSGGGVTITLPQASTASIPLYIKKTSSDANSVTVAAYAGDLVDGAASTTFSAQNYTAVYFSNGSTAWYGSADTTNASQLNGYTSNQTPTASTIVVSQAGSTFIHDDWIDWATKAGTGLTFNASDPVSGNFSVNAGDGLGTSGDNLVVNVDNTTIEINADTLRVKGDGIGQAQVGASAIGQAELKSTTGSVSSTTQLPTGIPSIVYNSVTLPGGEYGFFPQIKATSSNTAVVGGGYGDAVTATYGGLMAATTSTSYVTVLSLYTSASAQAAYAQQRYIQSSPPYKIGNTTWGHFLFVLRNTSTGKIISAYEAEDPCWAYNGPTWNAKDSADRIQAVPHPFASYLGKDLAAHGLEVALIDLRDFNVKEWKKDAYKRKKDSILEEVELIVKPSGRVKDKSEYGLPTIAGFTDVVKLKTRE